MSVGSKGLGLNSLFRRKKIVLNLYKERHINTHCIAKGVYRQENIVDKETSYTKMVDMTAGRSLVYSHDKPHPVTPIVLNITFLFKMMLKLAFHYTIFHYMMFHFTFFIQCSHQKKINYSSQSYTILVQLYNEFFVNLNGGQLP